MNYPSIKTTKRSLFSLPALCFLLTACTGGYGTKLQFKKGELFYTKNVTKEQAQKLGEYLVAQDFFDDTKKITAQLDKENDTLLFRLVVLDSFVNKPDYERLFEGLIPTLSKEALDGKPTVVHFCDDHLKTIKVVRALPATSAAALKGSWLCMNMEGGSPADPVKNASDIEVLKKNFTFQFFADGTFHSDFANEDDIETPKAVEGHYVVEVGKLRLSDLVIDGTPSKSVMEFTITVQNNRMHLINHNEGKPDLMIDFKRVND